MAKFINDQLDAMLGQLKDAHAKGDEATARNIGQALIHAIPASSWANTGEERPAPEPKELRGHIVSVSEFDEADAPLVALWQQIRQRLPPHMIDSEEKLNKTAWRIGFLLGVSGETIAAKLLRWFWRLP